MYCAFPPFREAKKHDPWYKNFFLGKEEEFWKTIAKRRDAPKISDSFKELINGMLRVKNRYTLNDILNSKWVNEQKIDLVSLSEDMKERKAIVMKTKNQLSESMQVDEECETNEKIYRGDNEYKEILEVFFNTFKKIEFSDLKQWQESDYRHNDFMKFKLKPQKLMEYICTKVLLKYKGIKVTLSESGYKGRLNLATNKEIIEDIEDIDDCPYDINVEFEIFEDLDDSSVVQFIRNENMNQYDFKRLFNGIRETNSNECEIVNKA